MRPQVNKLRKRAVKVAWLANSGRHAGHVFVLFACNLFMQGLLSAEDLRSWTDATGAFKKQAVFQRLEDGFVILKLEDGAIRRIPLAKLSTADQEYARAASSRSEVDPFEAIPTPDSKPAPKSTSRPSGHAVQEGDANIRVVTVEGVGVDVASAKTDAYREAVRQVVGAYVDSTAMAANDQLIEDKVITLSSAFVEKSEPLKEAQDGRLIRVRLRAHVRVNKLLDSLRANKISTTQVDSESLLGQAVTKADQAMGTADLVKKALPGLHKKILTATVDGKPEVKSASGDQSEVAFWLRVQPNLDAYKTVAEKLNAAWSASERPSGEVSSPGNAMSNGKDFREHVQQWKRNQTEWFLGQFLASEGDKKRMANTLDREGNTPVVRYDPLYVIADAQASPDEWGCSLYLLQDRTWRQLTKAQGDMIVLLLVNANSTGARTRWKWFKLTAAEADAVLACLKGTTKAVAVLKARDGSEVARDSVLLKSVGVKTLGPNAVAISPFFMAGDDLSHYSPALGVQRSVVLSRDEVTAVASIDAFIEEGDPLVVYGR